MRGRLAVKRAKNPRSLERAIKALRDNAVKGMARSRCYDAVLEITMIGRLQREVSV
jgi:hypothetical protein